jgi:hypothetical protein
VCSGGSKKSIFFQAPLARFAGTPAGGRARGMDVRELPPIVTPEAWGRRIDDPIESDRSLRESEARSPSTDSNVVLTGGKKTGGPVTTIAKS